MCHKFFTIHYQSLIFIVKIIRLRKRTYYLFYMLYVYCFIIDIKSRIKKIQIDPKVNRMLFGNKFKFIVLKRTVIYLAIYCGILKKKNKRYKVKA